jgi:hypothetical protein
MTAIKVKTASGWRDMFTAGPPGTPSDATPSAKGIIKLAGDLSGSADSPQIAGGAVGPTELATDAVTQVKVADNAIGAAELADGAVDFAAFASGALASAFALGTTTTITSDTNGRAYTPTKSVGWDRGGLTLFAASLYLNFFTAGFYMIFASATAWTAAIGSNASFFFLKNDASLLPNMGASGTIQKGASPSNNSGLSFSGGYTAAVNDTLKPFIYCSGGGTTQVNIAIMRMC